jgi:hypothetical protein
LPPDKESLDPWFFGRPKMPRPLRLAYRRMKRRCFKRLAWFFRVDIYDWNKALADSLSAEFVADLRRARHESPTALTPAERMDRIAEWVAADRAARLALLGD